MNELEKLAAALRLLKELEDTLRDYNGTTDFLENCHEPLQDIKDYITDTIAKDCK